MSSVDRGELSRHEEQVLRALEEHGEMRIETLAEELDIGYSEAKSSLHDLSSRGLVVSGPGLVYEADRDEIRSPQEV